MDNAIAKIYQSPKTVLTTADLALIWRERNRDNLKSRISYYVKQGDIIRLSRGIFVKDKDYDPKELAASVYKPSYISFETVLREAGFVFQYYENIFVAASWPGHKEIDGKKITFRKLKDKVLFNSYGIEYGNNYSVATPERAFLDTVYLFPKYYFDNLGNLNWERCFEMVKMYDNCELEKRLNNYYKKYAK